MNWGTLILEQRVVLLFCLRISSKIKCSKNNTQYKSQWLFFSCSACAYLVGIMPIRLGASPLNRAASPSVWRMCLATKAKKIMNNPGVCKHNEFYYFCMNVFLGENDLT